ncbi:MAG: hypothetical protein RR512_01225 [Coprobacillus sp.]
MAKLLKVVKLLGISVLCLSLLVGCSSNDKTTVAKFSVKNEKVDQTVEIVMKHDDESVKTQKQEGVMKFNDNTSYQTFLSQVKLQGYDAVAKDYKGIDYNLTSDDATFTIKESITLDFGKLSAEGYKKMTNGAVNVSDPYRIDVESTIKNLKAQGYTITEE